MSKRKSSESHDDGDRYSKNFKREGFRLSCSSDSDADDRHEGFSGSFTAAPGPSWSHSSNSVSDQRFKTMSFLDSKNVVNKEQSMAAPSYFVQSSMSSMVSRDPYDEEIPSQEDQSEELSASSDSDAEDGHEGFPSSFTAARNSSQATSNVPTSSVAERLMKKMGYQEGKGLGKHGQGRAAPIEASQQRGRRGLGLRLEGLEASADVEWTEEEDETVIEQTPDWIPACSEYPPQTNELSEWMTIDKRKLFIEDETTFCSQQILSGVLKSKDVFDALGQDEFLKARTRSNPYELVKGAIFQNRAAVKMANMDKSCDFMFTQPKDENGKNLLSANDILYFADVCSGPGGFSEYVLWRKKWHAKGFGFTIKGEHDFRLADFLAGSPETFEPYYGVDGWNGDGDVMREDNLVELRRYVMESTDNKGVHFVMGDGGFSVEGQENLQEILTKQLVLCQFLAALSILREGGHFVCKTFDLFTPFNVGLIYLLYRAFARICIFKPVTSRPANSERFVICQNLRPGAHAIHDYLFKVNVTINELRQAGHFDDVQEVVPLEVILRDEEFTQYMTQSNESLAFKQIRALKKLKAFVQNMNLVGPNQGEVRNKLLNYWEVPDEARAAPKRVEADEKFEELWKDGIDSFSCEPSPLITSNIKNIKWLHNFKCFVSNGERCFLLGLGRIQTFKWDNRKAKWEKLVLKVELPRDTLLDVEIVVELKGEGKGQRRLTTIHVIDAAFLGGKDIRDKHYQERLADITKFTKALSKPSRNDIIHLRVKQVMRLEDIGKIYERLQLRQMKGRLESLCYLCDDERYFVPAGVCVLKHINDPWLKCLSSKGYWYFFNQTTKKAEYSCPKDVVATFKACLMKRYLWNFSELGLHLNEKKHETALSRTDFQDFIERSRVEVNPKRPSHS